MKSHTVNMLMIWTAALKDAAAACSLSLTECDRDLSRIKSLIETRGLGVFTLDLPALDSALTTLLEDGVLVAGGPLTRCVSSKDLRPRFMRSLWTRVLDEKGCLNEHPDPTAIFFLRQLCCLGKKLAVVCSPMRTNRAVDEYHDIERGLDNPSLDWASDHLLDNRGRSDILSATFMRSFGSARFREDDLFGPAERPTQKQLEFLRRLDQVAGILVSGLGAFDSMSENTKDNGMFKHGPGAVADRPLNGYKYSFPSWPAKLEGVFPYDWCGSGNLSVAPFSGLEVEMTLPSNDEPASRLIAVPKTAKAPRLIASEPVAHQWCQQKVLSWIDFRMRKTLLGRFVDLHDQAASQRLVVQASIHRDLSTLDLSSASDRVTCRHVESLLRSNWTLLEAAHASRTRSVSDTVSGRYGRTSLKKFAAMGSALTFPVQSILFVCIALASAGAHSTKTISALVGKVRVFGDDIIIPSYGYADLVDNLHYLGLKVNMAKSFTRGFFRESCGADYWQGVNVTPVKPKTVIADAPQSYSALIDTANNLHAAGCWYAAQAVVSLLPSRFQRTVVCNDSGVLALKSFCGTDLTSLDVRYDKHLQRDYVRLPVYDDKVELEKLDTSAMLTQHFALKYSAERPRKLGVARRASAARAAYVRVDLAELGLTASQRALLSPR